MNSVWLRLQGDALDLGGNGLVIGAIYAAPLGSRVYSLGGRSSQDSVTRRVMDRVRALVRRFQQPGDEVLMLGDLNARVAGVSELPDVDGDAELAEFTQAELGQANLLRAIPPRRSEDTSDNVFGRALAALCQELELVVLNGRVNGDPQGACTFWSPAGQGRSMIDLFVASPALFFRADRLHVTNIPVAQSGVKVGSLMSDHCPVSLDLRVLRQGASPAGRSSPRARFDVRRKARYASRNQRVVAAASLNAPFSLAEVIAALKSLANHKSPGLERAPAECYKYATRKVEDKEELVLAPYLLRLLEHIRSTGDYPKQFEVSIVTPLHKKGDALDPSNYRGLAVGGALSKLYANLLDRRLKAWGESSGARSPYQGGFRPKRGTIHNLFLLRHLTDRCRRVLPNGSSQALFVCQIDFEKAFDRVNRDMLWLRLEERGVTGAALAALKRCYERVELRVKVNGTTGAAFPSSQGVKQGCPMSPTLFGFFVEGYADYVDALDVALPDAMAAPECPDVEGRRVPLALYADDLSLFAATKRRLMSLLRALREWSEVFGLTVNARKCELLLFHPSDQVRSHFYAINGLVTMRVLEDGLPVDRPITWKPRARYLGLHFGPNSSFASCTDELYGAGQRAMFSLLSKLRRQGLLLPFVGMKCFNAQVRSVLSYGSQLWGVDLVLALLERGYPANEAPRSCYSEVATRDRMVKLQIAFMKQLVGASVPPLQLLFRELGQMPLQMYWAESVFRFWNSMVENTSSIYHSVFRHEIRLALESDLQGDGWGTKIIRALNILRHDWPEDATAGTIDARVRRYSTCKLDVEALLDTLRGRINDDWASDRLAVDPCSFVTDGRKPGVKMCRHKHWMGQPKQFEGYIPPAHHRALLRFRLCVSDLAVNSESNRARELRVCKACRINGAVEDEKHFLMECSALVSARQKLWDLGVPEGASVCDVMQIDDQRGLAKVVYDMFCFRRERIAV
ncbi:hypothetical protein PLESTM_000905900 [Pleodorina starrii]|nr:hypothetical protein PLESTM_000905900 [Pleodorina starrii]